MAKKILIIILIFSISSCRWFKEATLPYTFASKFKVPPGTPAFRQGYKDGCSFLFYARGNGFYRFMHKYKYDPKMNGNPEYRFGYKRGISFCFNFIVPGVKSADRYIIPYDVAITAGDINKVGFFESGVDAFIPQAPGGGLDGVFQTWSGSGGNSVFGANPLWAGGSKGQFFGQ